MSPSIRRRTTRRHRHTRLRAWLLALLAGSSALVVAGTTPPASGEAPTTVRLVVERIEERGCTDTLDGSDFYGRVTIDGHDDDFGEIEDEDETDANWTAEQVVDLDTTTSVPVTVRVFDSDGFLNFEDNECDLTPGPGSALNLTVDLLSCTVGGDVTGACATQLTTEGGGDESAFIRFRVEVDAPPPPDNADDAIVRCLHSPLWPQPGDTVTITVEALDPALEVGDTVADYSDVPPNAAPPALVNRAVTVDKLEIWANGQSAPVQTAQDASTATYQLTNVAAGDLTYSCRVIAEGKESFTGWRRTRIGAPESGRAVPVVLTGPRSSRVDIVLVPDEDDYTAASDAAFLTGASTAIKGAYYGDGYYLSLQRGFNIWLAQDRGDSQVPGPNPGDPPDCSPVAPSNWMTDYSWADAAGVLHANRFRDCARGGGFFTSEPDSVGTVAHETGHRPFGLPDEYCCDGGYRELEDKPTLYDTKAECEADAPDLGRAAGDCRSFVDPRPDPDATWWTSEPDVTDLMNNDRHPPQAGDRRRIDWFFAECLDGDC